jgi:hypothetical protein
MAWCGRRAGTRPFPPGDFRPTEAHRDPGGDELQHELGGIAGRIRHVVVKRDTLSPVSCHDPHFNGRSTRRKSVPVQRQPMSLGEVGEHCRIAACGKHPPGRRLGLEPVLIEMLVSGHALHAILSIQEAVRSAAGIEHGRRGRQLLEAASDFLATRAITGGGQDRPAERLQFHLAAPACRGEMFQVHGEVILAISVSPDQLLALHRQHRPDLVGTQSVFGDQGAVLG